MNYLMNSIAKGRQWKLSVLHPETKQVIWCRQYPAFTEDAGTGELYEDFTLIDFGIMKSSSDNIGLEGHLKHIGVLSAEDALIPMRTVRAMGYAAKGMSVEKNEPANPVKVDVPEEEAVFDKGGQSKRDEKELFKEVAPSARFVLLRMYHEDLYQTGFDMSHPNFEKMKAGVQDAIDKGYLTASDTYGKYILKATRKMQDVKYRNDSKGKEPSPGIIEQATEMDKNFGKVLSILIEKKRLSPNAKFFVFNSGGNIYHMTLELSNGTWIMFSDSEAGISVFKKKFKTAEEAYEEFYEKGEDEKSVFAGYVMTHTSNYSKQRSAKDIADDLMRKNYSTNF
jgi:hypothetical protein